MKKLLLIGQAQEIDLIQPQVRAMLENEGVYIGGDSKQPELTVILFSQAGKIICMKPDMELAPDRFLDTLTLHGPTVQHRRHSRPHRGSPSRRSPTSLVVAWTPRDTPSSCR